MICILKQSVPDPIVLGHQLQCPLQKGNPTVPINNPFCPLKPILYVGFNQDVHVTQLLIKLFNIHPKAVLIENVSVWQQDRNGHLLYKKGIGVKTSSRQAHAPVKTYVC